MEKIATDNPFSDAQSATLTTLVQMLIPASAKYDVPGADDPEILADIIATARAHAEVVAEGLENTNARAEAEHGAPFAALAAASAMAIVDAMQESSPAFVRAVVAITVQCYYRNPRVMNSLGMEARAPYPKGFEVAQGDWSLLEPVRERGKIWRDAIAR